VSDALAPPSSPVRRTASALGPPIAGLAVAVTVWWAAIAFLVEPGSILARFAPGDGLATLGRLVLDGDVQGHVVSSVRRILLGLGFAALVGTPLGLALGSARLAARTSGPVLGLLRMVSPLSWTPVAIILFGVGDAPVVFLVAMGATWPVALNTAAGVAQLDPAWRRVARSLGATRLELLRHVVWPGIRPNVLTGLRIATGLAWVILVPAEMLGVDSGLGYFVLDARDRFAYNELVAAILLIGTLGFALDTVARLAFEPGHAIRIAHLASRLKRLAPTPRAAAQAGSAAQPR